MVWSRHGRRDHAVTAWARTRCPGPGVGGACLAIVEWIGPSVVEDGQVELVEARWVGDHVDLGNLVVLDRETDGQAQPSPGGHDDAQDRKSTRLNSSHVKISYAVFCLKKKK